MNFARKAESGALRPRGGSGGAPGPRAHAASSGLPSGLSFPGEPRLLSCAEPLAEDGRGWRPEPALQPSSRAPRRASVSPKRCHPLPPLSPAEGPGAASGLDLISALRPRIPSTGRVLTRWVLGRAVDLPRTPQETAAGASGWVEPPGRPPNPHAPAPQRARSGNRWTRNRSAGNGSAPAHESGAAAQNYRKAPPRKRLARQPGSRFGLDSCCLASRTGAVAALCARELASGM